jgi:CDGSH-type Zn-finger protein
MMERNMDARLTPVRRGSTGGQLMEQVEIKVRHNGPYKITGPVRVIDADDKPYDLATRGKTIALCRCGGSKTKPFCDGTHSQIGFAAAERAVAQSG